ncbi:conjugative transposon protein TraK [Riemerella anatipestifer]|uniref:conjugative transposon protein TraK n=1 Tax=Riemerella anatipestifer TaxID=34085 RepID=UPI002A894033|nr:conjugative transposon protein TraK [Riemerella anatipestifer]MDY3325755.1 conjugative transposon protein TraK [Riemerella anatipestifer]MDY3354297.1 conjugative transposon protein TraK [Riemerella anatipestifer]MEE3724528.1 conjugative transposon protein TraK [Riemerella anatipestifer]
MLVKSIEEKIKINHIVSISVIIASVIMMIAVLAFTYMTIRDSKKSMYVLDNGVPILVKQVDELLNRPVEYKSQIELFHRLFFTLPPDNEYIKENVEKSLYLIDDSGKKEYTNLKENGFYNQIVSSNSMVTIKTDSIKINEAERKFIYYGTQTINRKTALIIRRLITEGKYEDIMRTNNNPHGVMLKYWKIVDNSEISSQNKFY